MTSTISTGVTNTLKRTSSFANALKNLAFPHHDDGRLSPNHALSNKPDAPDYSRPPSPNLNFAQYTSPYSRPTTPTGRPWDTPPAQGKQLRGLTDEREKQQPIDFQPSDVMEALMEEDMERLKARRRAGATSKRGHHPGSRHHHSHHHPQHNGGDALPSPSGSTFSNDSNASVILGLGTGAGIRDVLPLKSKCYDWCSEYFKEPQMRVCVSLHTQFCVLYGLTLTPGSSASGERRARERTIQLPGMETTKKREGARRDEISGRECRLVLILLTQCTC